MRAVAPEHAAYWQASARRGYLGGPFADRSGGLERAVRPYRDGIRVPSLLAGIAAGRDVFLAVDRPPMESFEEGSPWQS